MSADNGIYILDTPCATGGREYRVANLQAIDNLWCGIDQDEDKSMTMARKMWSDCQAFRDLGAAYIYADTLVAAHIENFGYGPEYGISRITIERPFDATAELAATSKLYRVSAQAWGYVLAQDKEEAAQVLEDWFGNIVVDGWSMDRPKATVAYPGAIEKEWRDSIPFKATDDGDTILSSDERTVSQILKAGPATKNCDGTARHTKCDGKARKR